MHRLVLANFSGCDIEINIKCIASLHFTIFKKAGWENISANTESQTRISNEFFMVMGSLQLVISKVKIKQNLNKWVWYLTCLIFREECKLMNILLPFQWKNISLGLKQKSSILNVQGFLIQKASIYKFQMFYMQGREIILRENSRKWPE